MQHRQLSLVALLLASGLLISGCGQKGDLYKPESRPSQSSLSQYTSY